MLVKFGDFVGAGAGSIGGTSYQNTRSGTQRKVKPKIRKSYKPKQVSQRAVFANMAALWQGLTPTERQSWLDATVDFPVKNKVGELIQLSGYALFQQINLLSQTGGFGYTKTAPAPYTVAPYDFKELALDAGLAVAVCESNNIAARPDQYVLVYMSRPQKQGVTYVSPKDMRFVKVESLAVSSNFTILGSEYEAATGSKIVKDYKYFITLIVFDKNTYLASFSEVGSGTSS